MANTARCLHKSIESLDEGRYLLEPKLKRRGRERFDNHGKHRCVYHFPCLRKEPSCTSLVWLVLDAFYFYEAV